MRQLIEADKTFPESFAVKHINKTLHAVILHLFKGLPPEIPAYKRHGTQNVIDNNLRLGHFGKADIPMRPADTRLFKSTPGCFGKAVSH